MNENETEQEFLEPPLNQSELFDNQDKVVYKNEKKGCFYRLKHIVKIIVLLIDALVLISSLASGNLYISITVLVVFAYMFCIYVRLASSKFEKKELFQKIEKYFSNILLSVIFVEKIICYITYLGIILFKKPVDSEDYGYGILVILPIMLAIYIDMYVYPFLFIYSEHKITKLIIKSAVIFVILNFFILMYFLYR